MDCQRCGYAKGPFEMDCPKCARQARSASAALPDAANRAAVQTGRAPDGQAFKFCPACAQPAAPAMLRCGRCGFQYFSAAENPRNALKDTARSGYPVAAVGAAALVALAVGLTLLSVASRHKSRPSERLTMLSSADGGQSGAGSGASLFGAAISDRQFDARLASAAASTGGEVEVTLAWNTLTDLDLQVREPSGELITASHPHSASGGAQDVDANPTLVTDAGHALLNAGRPCGAENIMPLPEILVDLGSKMPFPEDFPGVDTLPNGTGKARSKFTRQPIEHIYFQRAPHGIYTVFAQCYSWREPNRTPLAFTVQVRSGGKNISCVTATLGPTCFAIDGVAPLQVCQFRIQ